MIIFSKHFWNMEALLLQKSNASGIVKVGLVQSGNGHCSQGQYFECVERSSRAFTTCRKAHAKFLAIILCFDMVFGGTPFCTMKL